MCEIEMLNNRQRTQTTLTVCSYKCETFSALLRSRLEGLAEDPALESAILPYLWHWLYTHETPASAKLGGDGHPEERPQGVPEHFTRRLWASSTVKVLQPIRINQTLMCTVTTETAELKEGKSGPLAFVPMTIELSDDRGILLIEQRVGVYRPMPDASTASSSAASETPDREQRHFANFQTLNFDEISLFRYSALLGVNHRIHYDFNYATRIEGYSNLLIHGPFLAQLLMLHAIQKHSVKNIDSVVIRCFSPNVLHAPLRLLTDYFTQSNQIIAWSENELGTVTMKLTIQLH